MSCNLGLIVAWHQWEVISVAFFISQNRSVLHTTLKAFYPLWKRSANILKAFSKLIFVSQQVDFSACWIFHVILCKSLFVYLQVSFENNKHKKYIICIKQSSK